MLGEPDEPFPKDEQALRAYRCWKQKAVLNPRYSPSGPTGHCFDNAARRAYIDGGRVLWGWAVGHVRNKLMRSVLSGCNLSGTHLLRHAIWVSPKGRYFEVTEGLQGLPFVPWDEPSAPSANLYFVDGRTTLARCKYLIQPTRIVPLRGGDPLFNRDQFLEIPAKQSIEEFYGPYWVRAAAVKGFGCHPI